MTCHQYFIFDENHTCEPYITGTSHCLHSNQCTRYYYIPNGEPHSGYVMYYKPVLKTLYITFVFVCSNKYYFFFFFF